MPDPACSKVGCTVADTNKCLLGKPEPTDCPHFQLGPTKTAEVAGIDPTDRSPHSAMDSAADYADDEGPDDRTFHSGLELGASDILPLTRSGYHHMIGVLGFFEAGKTCLLSSLYLGIASRLFVKKYRFAGSATLRGFELRARHLRNWDATGLPEKLSDHTMLSDPRSPAFLHLALEAGDSRRRVEVLLSDLPGEWCSQLVARADVAERFRFLERCDGVVLVVDGLQLSEPRSTQNEVHRTRRLVERLVENVGVRKSVPFVLAVSKFDRLPAKPAKAVRELVKHAEYLGLRMTVEYVAAFSSRPSEVRNGYGVEKMLSHILLPKPGVRRDWPLGHALLDSDREFLQFGKGGW